MPYDDDRDAMYEADKAEHLRAEREWEMRRRKATFTCDECGGAMEDDVNEDTFEPTPGYCLTPGCPCSRQSCEEREPFDPAEYQRFLASLPF